MRSRKHSNNGRNVGNGVSPVEGTTLKGTVLKMLLNKVFITKVLSNLNTPCISVKSASANVFFYTNNSKMPDFEL